MIVVNCHMNYGTDTPTAPIAKKKHHLVKFGKVEGENRGDNPMNPPLEKIDPYYWMRDDSRSNEEILTHLELENDYTKKNMKNLTKINDSIYDELLSHVKETDTTDFVPNGHFVYYSHTLEGSPYPIHCRRDRENINSLEEVILDENKLSDQFGTTQMNVGNMRISPSQNLLGFSVDTSGDEIYEILIKNLSINEIIFTVSDISSFEWGSDDNTIFYTKMDSAHRPYQVWKLKLNDSNYRKLIYEENDELFWVGISKTQDNDFLLISSSSKETSEVHYLELKNESINLNLIKKREKGILYSVSKRRNTFYIVTNFNEAKNFQILTSDIKFPSEWNSLKDKLGRVLFEHNNSRTINYSYSFKNFIIVFGRENGLKQLWCLVFEDNQILNHHKLEFPEDSYVVGLGSNLEFSSKFVRITYSSMVTPQTIFDYDVDSKELIQIKQKDVPNYDRLNYCTDRIFAPSTDGTLIPISVVYRKDMHKESIVNSKLMLYGYGSYGLCIEPSFNAKVLPMLNRGIVYCIAHVRGGSEMGRFWYEEEGKYLTKMNTFEDFCSCAEHLIRIGWTSPSNIAIEGRSAGGLLIGAVLNMRPDLFNVAIAGVPFVDVMTTMSDPSIPLTVVEWEEWGNPNEEKFHEYIKSYSPIDNVTSQKYPNILITAGLHDPRVAYWEAMKWCATLREKSLPDSGLILLKTDLEAGHFSASDRYKYLKEKAFEYAFLFRCLGI